MCHLLTLLKAAFCIFRFYGVIEGSLKRINYFDESFYFKLASVMKMFLLVTEATSSFAVELHVCSTLHTFAIICPIATRFIFVLANGLIAEATRFPASNYHLLWISGAQPRFYQTGTVEDFVIPTGVIRIATMKPIQFKQIILQRYKMRK